ncbi:putative Rossmann fold enzyme [Methanolinea mesophila]|uniref:6-hydroxymethylpterin diphosphokinase MptE-like protein n=1 Tax=Methanolinea mesophila TaxID=547055 RepID=UPI001AE6A1D5|nr:6-hydroxymethylpterin diphosphokinase MptE-like protein [Methanolinea mesophila]MBP1929857.1 putative Rossmann fold enzyme [Methanolinea mesophila]
MNFEEWEPHYLEILDYFGFSREDDEDAARVLAGLLTKDDLPVLSSICRGGDITVCGNAPTLKREVPVVRGKVFAADAAAEVLLDHGIRPAAVFTDLDGATDRFIEMNREGTVMVVHAHGDNIPLLRHWVPRFPGPLVGTTQSRPLPHVHNFGGFTDGDRAVFAADALGAARIRLAGFDCGDTSVDPVKRGKLFWARTLLGLLGYEC